MWSTWGASPWEGKSGAEVGIVNTKVARFLGKDLVGRMIVCLGTLGEGKSGAVS